MKVELKKSKKKIEKSPHEKHEKHLLEKPKAMKIKKKKDCDY